MQRLMIALVVLLGLFSPIEAPAADRRNVVMIVADDLGLDLGCYGNAKLRTPNIDAFASRGTRFTHAFATVASCSPSRAVMLTGLFTHTNGQYGLAHDVHHAQTFRSVRSVPKRLKESGLPHRHDRQTSRASGGRVSIRRSRRRPRSRWREGRRWHGR